MHPNKYNAMTQPTNNENMKQEDKKPQDNTGIKVEGHIKIWDPITGEVIVDKRNAIHYENMSIALANSLANKSTGFVHEMAFGNGGTSVDPTGIITYLTPNTTGSNASLYNQTYYKVVDDNSATNKDTTRNKMEIRQLRRQLLWRHQFSTVLIGTKTIKPVRIRRFSRFCET